MASYRNVPWRVPALMLLSLLAAVSFAIGHHFFYRSFNLHPVHSKPLQIARWSVTEQQINIAVGTGFAFLFKAALAIATSMAYIQLFFHALWSTSCTLKRLDNLLSGPTSLMSFFQIVTYYRQWLLTSTALIVWLLPIAAVFPPAALTIDFAALPPSVPQLSHVAQVGFESLALGVWKFIAPLTDGALFEAIGPALDVIRVTSATATTGSILPITPPGSNATWLLNTKLPQMICDDIGESEVGYKKIKANIEAVILSTLVEGGSFDPMGDYCPSYVSWLRISSDGPFRPMPSGGWSLQVPGMTSMGMQSEGDVYTDLYFAVFDRAPIVDSDGPWGGEWAQSRYDWYFESARLLRCSLYEANYSLLFTIDGTDQAQSVNVLSVETLKRIEPQPLPLYMKGPFTPNAPFKIGAWDVGPISNLSASDFLRHTSYHFIWRAFSGLVTGASNKAGGGLGEASFLVNVCPYQNGSGCEEPWPVFEQDFQTQIFATSLRQTQELSSIIPMPSNTEADPATTTYPWFKGIQDPLRSLYGPHQATEAVRQSLQSGLEELFFNISISMASMPSLTYNETNPFAPPAVEVTYNLYDNLYFYAPAKLWFPYGAALIAASLNVLFGLWIIYSTGTSFAANFSSIFRVAKNTCVDADTKEDGRAGREPRPKELAKATLRLKTDLDEPKQGLDGASLLSRADRAASHSEADEEIGDEVRVMVHDRVSEGTLHGAT